MITTHILDGWKPECSDGMMIGILGGGLTGLTIASTLKKGDYEILEKNKECGGLCRSVVEEGFTFDCFGGHILYSREKWFLEWVGNILGENNQKKKRNNRILIKDRKIKYPFENDLAGLPIKDNIRCLYYYLFNKYSKTKPQNFKHWIYHTFGKGIAELYLIPYNEKIWNHKTEDMSLHWVEGRVPKPPRIDVLKSAIGIPTEGYKHQLYFYYPKHGGIQALIKALEQKATNIKTGFEVRKIRKQGSRWVVNDSRSYDKLISTIPIMELIGALDDVPPKVREAAKNLKFNSLVTVLLGLDAANPTDMTAIYIPDKKFLFHRVCFMNNFSEYNSPKGKFGLVAEITVNKSELDDSEITEHTINGLNELKLINKKDIVYTKVVRTKYAYVVYDSDYLANIKIVCDYVKSLGIILCGRFAEFEYLNMDACIKRALVVGKCIMSR